MADRGERAFGFSGTWRDYAPIALTNLLLTIVTLGVYRFWATTRTRRYLWSRTRFIDEPLEWTGTGMELFIGFLLVLGLFGLPFLFLQFGFQALILQGYMALAFTLAALAAAMIFYLAGVAVFRMVRYRLSRTWWHGIRGGSDDKGWAYGWSNVWRYLIAGFSLYLLMPWAMISLWNDRWSAMSFGPFRFSARAPVGPVYRRFLLFYLLPFGLIILAATIGLPQVAQDPSQAPDAAAVRTTLLFLAALFIGFYVLLPLIALLYYAKYMRVVIGGLSLSTLDFRFTARSKDWFLLILGDIALVVFTFGIGAIFLAYRHWKFFSDHLDATGEISRASLTQSTTAAPGQGEGLADAFDLGAI
ncbi:MAG: DUF898 domain-containing protein [Sphingomonadales bacterium]|nr:DUF898 domain-containing protein [Sphingomonadales bacterium]